MMLTPEQREAIEAGAAALNTQGGVIMSASIARHGNGPMNQAWRNMAGRQFQQRDVLLRLLAAQRQESCGRFGG
jgi:hypothetical protein